MKRILILLALLMIFIFFSIPVSIVAQQKQQTVTSRMKKERRQPSDCKKRCRIKKHDWIWIDEKPIEIKIYIIKEDEDVTNVEDK